MEYDMSQCVSIFNVSDTCNPAFELTTVTESMQSKLRNTLYD